jgi:copper resistance protein B
MFESVALARPARAALALLMACGASPTMAQHSHHDAAPTDSAAVRTPTPAERAAAFPDLGDMSATGMMLSDPVRTLVRLDRFEAAEIAAGTSLLWDLDASIGRDRNRLLLRTEGERLGGDTERAWLEALWGRSFARWWSLAAGARHDFAPGESQDWLAFGVSGLAPYRLALDATVYLGDAGRAALRVKAQYEVLITNRLLLQPLFEASWHSQSDRARALGAGLADAELGLRLRYEIRREVAPYVGLVRARRFGGTAALAPPGTPIDDTRLVAGVRLAF